MTKIARGIRNNNPLNIKIAKRNNWKGRVPLEENTDGVFEQYTDIKFGVRAALKLIQKYIVSGINTVPTIIHRWCPPMSANDDSTKIYTKYVLKACTENLDEFHTFTEIRKNDYEVLFVVLSAMCCMESNYRLPSDIFLWAWMDLNGSKSRT